MKHTSSETPPTQAGTLLTRRATRRACSGVASERVKQRACGGVQELEGAMARALERHGVAPASEGLSDDEYLAAMARLAA